jgi:hypothetical protein
MELCNQLHTSVHSGYGAWLGCYQLLTLEDPGYDCMDMCYKLTTLVHMPQKKVNFDISETCCVSVFSQEK